MEATFEELSEDYARDAEREGISERLDELIRMALAEDLPDATAQAIFAQKQQRVAVVVHGRVMAKARGVLAGVCAVPRVFRAVDPRVRVVLRARDGCAVAPGDVVADVVGPAAAVLAGERTALNFVQRMSGVATASARCADAAGTRGMCCRVLDTRKTLPAWRVLDKYAVRVGGMRNHRMSLADMAMIKDNHADAAGGIVPAVALVRAAHPQLPVEVEVRNERELREALGVRPSLDRVMLDNMSLSAMRAAVAVRDAENPAVRLEASGGVTMETLAAIAETGVDFVSVGATTHSVAALDFNMKVVTVDGGDAALWPLLDERRAAAEKAARAALQGAALFLVGRYQRPEVAALGSADCSPLGAGDILEKASRAQPGSTIVVCAPWHLAEVAAAIAPEGCRVLSPLQPRAPDVSIAEADAALLALGEGTVPVVAVGGLSGASAGADLVAWAGDHGGAACTSKTAAAAIAWAIKQGKRCFFLPDINLCESAAAECGLNASDVLRWSPLAPSPPTAGAVSAAKVVVWAGACAVRQRLSAADVAEARKAFPGARILVHMRCPGEVRRAADEVATTGRIAELVAAAPAGTDVVVGDERRSVDALAASVAAAGKTVRALGPVCRCMQSREGTDITLAALADASQVPASQSAAVRSAVSRALHAAN